MNQQVEDTERDEIFARLRQDPNNNKCFDCEKKNPKWSSVYLGIYLCLDCAGKHREYGPQISFARSINLDSWNRRYITFMELGGNTKAADAFRKNGLKTPYDYKCAAIQKYKQELTKKVDAALGAGNKVEEPKPVASKPEEPKNLISNGPAPIITGNNILGEEKKADNDDPFANNVIINKSNVQTKGFSVEFNKKPTFGTTNKGRLAAKKIDNVDLDSLTLNEDGSEIKTSKTDLMPTSAGLKMSQNSVDSTNEVKEVYAKTSSPYLKETDQDTFNKYKNAKAISSDSFNTQKDSVDRAKMNQFSGASSISSAQYYGEKEEPANQGIDYYQVGENVKDFVNVWGGKLKEKSEGWMSKIKSEWQQ